MAAASDDDEWPPAEPSFDDYMSYETYYAEEDVSQDEASLGPRRSYGSDGSSTMPSLVAPSGNQNELWLCRACDGADWRRNLTGDYSCNRCGHTVFYDAFRAASFTTGLGSWTFVPKGSPVATSSESSSVNRRNTYHGDPGPEGHDGYEAYAESETLTNDPSVDPVTLQPVKPSRRQRKAAKRDQPARAKADPGPSVPPDPKVSPSPQEPRPSALPVPPKEYQSPKVPVRPKESGLAIARHPHEHHRGPAGSDEASSKNAAWRDAMLRDLHGLAGKKEKDEKPWSIRKGPEPGLKYRGGTPPQPPQWTYSKGDLQAFQRWERKLTIWRRQIASYLPPNESAMMLYVHLKGEAEEELEYCDLDRVDSPDGVDYILETLRAPLMVKGIYLKRRFLDEFERLNRRNGESVKAFCNRYHRVERSLQSVGVRTDQMYDADAAGSRLLDRLRLGIDAQRMILVATGQSLRYQDIKDAAEIQFPDHRPVPPVVYARDFESKEERQDRQSGAQNSQKSNNPSSSNSKPQYNKNYQKGKQPQSQQRGSAFVKKAYITQEGESPDQELEAEQEGEHQNEPNDEEATAPADEVEGDAEQEADEEAEEVDALAELSEVAQCLTVTARRLQGITLGRKFSGSKTIQQRKAESHCTICGGKGHWKGDPECPSTDPKNVKSDKNGNKPQPKNGAKKVLHVQHADGSRRSVTFENPLDNPNEENKTYGNFFTYMVTSPIPDIHQVFGSLALLFMDSMVLDTACQKSCCSSVWLTERRASLEPHKLRVRTFPCREPFEFGHGPTQYSHEHAQIPACFDHKEEHMMLLGASVISTTNNIPFLASNDLMANKLQMILNLPEKEAYLGALKTTVPIYRVAGHLVLSISSFPKSASNSPIWDRYQKACIGSDADAEMIYVSADGSSLVPRERPCDEQGSTANMDAGMEEHGEPVAECRATTSPSPHSSSEPPNSTPKMAGASGSIRPGLQHGSDQEGNRPMPAREHAAIREQARKLCEMQPVRQALEVVRQPQKVDRSGITKAAVAAIALILNGLQLPGQEPPTTVEPDNWFKQPTSQSSWSSLSEYIDAINPEYSDRYKAESAEGSTSQVNQHQAQADQRDASSSGRGGKLGLRLGSGQSKSLKKGTQSWLTGHLRNASKIYEQEVDAYNNLISYAETVTDGPKIDLIEIFAGSANLTFRAPRHGLSALEPIDKTINVDLLTEEGRTFVWQAIIKFKPLLVHVAWPCRFWSLFNENLNYSHRMDELNRLREEERPLVEFGARVMIHQDLQNRLYLGENPLKSRIWEEPGVREVADSPNALTPVCDAGAYGAEDSEGFPIIKTHKWLTNSLTIAEELCRRMTPEQKQFARAIEGRETEASGHYCDGLVDAILRGLAKEAQVRDPARFVKANQAFYVQPSHNEQLWGNILDELEHRFENTHKRPYNMFPSDPLYGEIEKLIPWKLERVQVTWTPQARRWPTDIPFTHRGAVLKTTAGKILLEHEDLAAITYPKQRYAEPIRLGLHFFGVAPEDEDEKEAEQPPPPPPAEEASYDVRRRVPGITTDIWFECTDKEIDKKLQSSLARLHTNMGHPCKEELVRILAASNNLSGRVLAGLEALRCGSCLRMTTPKKPPVTSTTTIKACQFGDRLQADIVYIRTLTLNVAVLGVIDEFTNYMVAHTLTDRHPPTVLKLFLQIWYHPLGLPHHVTVDPDTAFLGEMEEWHNRHGIEYDIIPAEEHWRIGKIERRNALMRSLVERLVDHHGITSREALDEAIVAATFSLNSSTYSHGRSPFQAVFGRIPRPLGDLLSDEKALVLSPVQDEHIFRPELLRAEATTALMQLNTSQAVRRGLLRKTRNQQELHQLQPGQTVAFWRWQGRARQHKRGSWSLGRFLAFDPDKKSCWIQVGKTSLRVGTGQLRQAAGWEAWTPSEEDVKLLKDAEANISQGLWDDSQGDPPGEDELALADEEIFNFRPIQERAHPLPEIAEPEEAHVPEHLALPAPGTVESQPMDMASFPSALHGQPSSSSAGAPASFEQTNTAIQQQLLQQHQQQQMNTYIDRRTINVNVDSPTYQQFGGSTNFGAVPPTPRNRPRSRTPSRAPRETDLHQSEQRPALAADTPALEDQPSTPAPETPALQDEPAMPVETLPQLPMKRPSDVLVAKFQSYDDGTIARIPDHWDGGFDPQFPFARKEACYKAYLNSSHRKVEMQGIPEPERPDLDSSSDEELTLSSERSLTRQELKQLDREIPWRDIMQMDSTTIELYVNSAANEYAGWLDWSQIRPLSREETKEVFANPRLRKRVMKARAAYRDKNRGKPPLKPKTRVVIIGCGDPDLRQLSRDSPTPTRLSELVILAIAAAGANREFNNDGCLWALWLSDAEKAFLQGSQDTSERDGPIFMQSPRDPILEMANAYPSELYEVIGNCYGLCNAPRTWYKKVDHDLKMEQNFQQHSFDRCCYYHLNKKDGSLDCVLIVHVDDFMAVYNTEKFPVSILQNMFKWGSTTQVSLDTPGEYRGKEITMTKEPSGKISYTITQTTFINALQEGTLPRGRLKGDSKLTSKELAEFRSVIGSLQWLGGQTRPDLGAIASLSHKGANTEISDLQRVYEAIRYVRQTAQHGIKMSAVPLNKGTTILAYGDSSWCNAANYTSQFGVLIVLCPPQVTEKTCNGLLVDWKSGRMQRVSRSTLASEAHAADEAADRACFVNYFLTELLYQIPAYKGKMEMPMKQATDAKSLFDCLVAENPVTLEKRSMVSIRSVQQSMTPKEIHWIPTHIMHADGLTKIDPKLQQALTIWCMNPWCQLREEKDAPRKFDKSKNSATGGTAEKQLYNKDQCEDFSSQTSDMLCGTNNQAVSR